VDKDLIRFYGKVITVAERQFRASCSGKEAESFIQMLYTDFKHAGMPKDVEQWLDVRLQKEFLCVAEPPRWVEDEPAWPFYQGKPMVFVSQMTLHKNSVTEQHLTWDAELYLFGARVNLDRGYRVEYYVVTQIAGINGQRLR
jgi:hypothetical protein